MLSPSGPITALPTCRACKGSGVDRQTDLLCDLCDGSGLAKSPTRQAVEAVAGGALLLTVCWLGWAAAVLA